ncbi:MAG: hypothetical protein HGA85_00305 [Nanoarchaeota archaeon]|nr:hypothetical protein [Nanoarchaeota archaeon]
MAEKTSIGEILDSVELRNRYDEKREKYLKLVEQVSLILAAAIEVKGIKIHSQKSRVKDYKSFLEKIERKRYTDPFKECSDLGGCRVICLFSSQIEEIKNIIEKEFDIVEVTDKRSVKRFDQFGYLSLHMLVKLPKRRINFVEYTELEDLICEIQIRTILQEAWAEIEHYLNYKVTKEEKEEALLRKIFSLAGMFEVADSTFEEINQGFFHLVEKKSDDSITALNLYKFSKEHFPWFSEVWDKNQERRYSKLSDEVSRFFSGTDGLKQLLVKHDESLARYEKANSSQGKDRHFAPIGLIRAAMAIEYGTKFDMVFGLKGYSEKIRSDLKKGLYNKY